MVYFVCSTCGSALKKNQVTTHWFKCRQSKHVSCMDCGKDFWGEEYASHLKCITEDQKYGGKNYVLKESKGEKKQEEWVMKIKEKVANSESMDRQLRMILQSILNYSNIPRKEAKFRNFMRSSMKVSNLKLMDRVWEIFKDANVKTDTNNVKNDTENSTDNGEKNNTEDVQETKSEGDVNGVNDTAKLNKREKKELRKEKQDKKSKKTKLKMQSNNNATSGTKRELENEEEKPDFEITKPKKKKKNKKGESLVEEEQTIENVEPKKKKRKVEDVQEESFIAPNENHANGEEIENREPLGIETPSAFKWTTAISRVLRTAPQEGMKVSKLQRKVFSLYFAAHGEGSDKSKAELVTLLHKKLNKRNKFVMYKNKVKFRT